MDLTFTAAAYNLVRLRTLMASRRDSRLGERLRDAGLPATADEPVRSRDAHVSVTISAACCSPW